MGSGRNYESSEKSRIERENQWVKQMQRNNARAFEEMYLYYVTRLSQFVFRYVHSVEIAKDVIQNVFFGVWRNRKNLKVNGKLRSYLYSAARNEALNFLRKKNDKFYKGEWDFSLMKSSRSTPEEKLVYTEFEETAKKIIDQLPERRRQIFLMQREDELTYREIAEILDISIKTVETQMSRSLKFLRKNLSEFIPLMGAIAPFINQLLR